MEKTANNDLVYCQNLLSLLEEQEKNEHERSEFLEHFVRQILRRRKWATTIGGFILLFIIALGEILSGLDLWEIDTELVIILLIYLVYLFFNFRSFKVKPVLEQVNKKQRLVYDVKMKQLEEKHDALEMQIEKFHRISKEDRSVRNLRHIIRYFERGEAQDLSEAFYFLTMDKQ